MAKWTRDTFRDAHLPHRLGVIRAFLNRTGEEPPDVHCGLKDGALITCRVLWEILGVRIDSRKEKQPDHPTAIVLEFKEFRYLPADVAVRFFTCGEFVKLPSAEQITLTLVAANKCVAHIDEYPDHGVDEEVLDTTIDTTLAEIDARISR